jgi:SAM-dependent methyltransferase
MTDQQLAHSYVLEASEAEHARLLSIAQVSADGVRDICARAGLGEGVRVVDVGCGPIGALVELAQIVGPRGSVVGIDSSAQAVETARAIVASQGLSTVQVVNGDIHTIDPSAMPGGGPFDAAHLRLMLIYQPDPVLALRRIAGFVRPGGFILVTDQVTDHRYPWFDPPLPIHQQIGEWAFEASRRQGGAIPSGALIPSLCGAAGLRVVDVRGTFTWIPNACEQIDRRTALLQSARRPIIDLGVASEAEVGSAFEALAAARDQDFRYVLGGLLMQVVAQVQ